MEQSVLQTAILAALSGGCGVVNKWLLDKIVEWKDEDQEPISPKTRRRLALLLSALTPSALYAFLALMGWATYNVGEHAGYIVTAFTAGQMWHGERELPSGHDLKVQERLDAVFNEPPPRSPLTTERWGDPNLRTQPKEGIGGTNEH